MCACGLGYFYLSKLHIILWVYNFFFLSKSWYTVIHFFHINYIRLSAAHQETSYAFVVRK